MRKYLPLILILLLLWILLGLYFCNKHLCGYFAPATKATTAVPIAAPVKDKCANPFSIKDGSSFTSKSCNHYQFLKSSFNPLAASGELTSSIDKTINYLKSNKNRSLLITGFYNESESNPSILDNIGLARANGVKGQLIRKGVSGAQLDITSKMAKNSQFKKDTLDRAISFSFADAGSGSDRVSEIKQRLFGKPITLYFGTNQDNINLSTQQRKDFTDLNYYLDKVASAKLAVEGHTDNVGARDYNVNLSKERADFVKSYLQDKGGISNQRMDVNGFGPDKPIGSNATDEGKAKNRRVEVILK